MDYSIIILLIILIFSLRYKNNIKINKVLIPFLIFFLSFTYQMGIDWTIYKYFYEEIVPKLDYNSIFFIDNTKRETFERGYVLLNYIFYKLGFSYEIFKSIVLCWCNGVILNFLRKKTINYYIAIILIYLELLFPYNVEPGIRQFISISIVTFSFKYINKENIIKYILIILIASQFHSSAIICIIFYFLKYIKNLNIKRIVVVTIIGYLIFSNLYFILTKMITITGIGEKYLFYFNNGFYGNEYKRSFVGNVTSWIKYILFIIPLLVKENGKEKNCYKILGFIFALIIVYGNFLPIVNRVAAYLAIPFVINISKIERVNFLSRKLKKFYIAIIGTLGIFLFTYQTLKEERLQYKQLYYKNYIIDKILGKLNIEKKDYIKYRIKYEELQRK